MGCSPRGRRRSGGLQRIPFREDVQVRIPSGPAALDSAAGALADRGEIHDLAASGRGLEEARDLIVEEREARGAEAHRGSGELEATAGDATSDLRNTIPALAETL